MSYCTTCGTAREPGHPFCTGCGTQVNAAQDASASLAWPTRPRSRGPLLAALVTLVLLLGGGAAAWVALTHADPAGRAGALPPRSQPAGSSPVHSDASASLRAASVSASCMSSPGHDANGVTVTYEPERIIDGSAGTAWRCDGDGVGQRLEISFPNVVTLTSIGIVPGYTKTDPYDGTDRYAQNRRISAVHYTFDDGSTVLHSFATSASYRALQTLGLPEVSTSRVTITILSSVSGEVTNGQQPFNKVAISEVAVTGR